MSDPESLPSIVNVPFLERLYADFVRDPAAVSPQWSQYFRELSNGEGTSLKLGPSFPPHSLFNPPHGSVNGTNKSREVGAAILQDRVDQLVRAYRVRGHISASIDPLGRPQPHPPELEPEFYGLTDVDMERKFSTHSVYGSEVRTLREIIERLRNTYCRSIGAQFMHIDSLLVRQWLQEYMEGTENRLQLSRDEQLRILTGLTEAVVFEEFIQKRFVGAKSFSLEGAESLIPLLRLAIDKAAERGVKEIVLAMAHRGRLNVLANIMGKNPRAIFREFEDFDSDQSAGRGDVKYHLGYSNDWVAADGHKMHLSLCFNPSHLEFVNPVAMGRVRAKQDRAGDKERIKGMALVIHGDAAFAGEGVVQETLNLSELKGYAIGGTLHVIINNQIGFTTPPSEGRSSTYATDVAKMLQSPIFHVNGEDPEAVAQVITLAIKFHAKFKRDVIVDMYCFRRRGHNETDEPSFTQPLMYRDIKNRGPVRESYLNNLLEMGGISREEADRIVEECRERLDKELSVAREAQHQRPAEPHRGIWEGYFGGPDKDVPEVETSVEQGRLAELLRKTSEVPETFHVHRTIQRALEQRRKMADGELPLDWAAAEAAAFAALATEGSRIRFSGQDVARGTFSHRHAVLTDVEDGSSYMPLRHVAPNQAPVELYNSPLSETAVLGFEYGYSLDCPEGLVLWEAQFGDFVNAAQVIIDQFMVSAEDKWRRLSGVVLLLPHGFEGMGPEHSSARLERFLTLAAEDNIQVANLTTPAQYFHILRRQVLRPWRKPLVIMTPKSLLRHPGAVSPLEEFTGGRFQRVITDERLKNPQSVSRTLLCTGKVYYDLEKERQDRKRDDVAIVRVEQLYPLAPETLYAALEGFPADRPVYWVQEEPENMGAWRYMLVRFGCKLLDRWKFKGVYRPESASPATGSAGAHKMEQQQLLAEAFGD